MSQLQEGKYQLISPDIATCPSCLAEVTDPKDRRYRYPFTNCTNCGPRFTIIREIPYDRARTTMVNFKMCRQCQQEYDDPSNRRFHAQPNACSVCGPRLELTDGKGNVIAEGDDAFILASDYLIEGKIIAIKGLGGFLLSCDATNDEAVDLLRKRKHRPSKPLAVMFKNLDEAKRHCHISKEEAESLLTPQSPIVLVKWQERSKISKLVAPGLKHQGVMLPYTPLHHILLNDVNTPLVMTSGNLSEEPIVKDNEEALLKLGNIADYFLMHNRDIYSRYDDSVVMMVNQLQVIRRARGYAPSPIQLPYRSRRILACGGEMKNTFCLAHDKYAFISQHIADMESIETLEYFDETIKLYKKLFKIEPQIITHDLHPDYLSSIYAKELASRIPELQIYPVQHHHAHIVSCMLENGVDKPVIGVAFDGTGYGSDGCIWGGEFLVADYKGFKRMGHLEYTPLIGGDTAIKKPYRMAISYIYSLFGKKLLNNLPFVQKIDSEELAILEKQIDKRINAPLTSSCGRLFDVVSAVLGIRSEINYEAQAAIELEMIAMEGRSSQNKSYPFTVKEQNNSYIISFAETLNAIISELKKETTRSEIAYRFHKTISQMIVDVCLLISTDTGISRVALSGGVFQNRLLFNNTLNLLDKKGFDIITHSQVPTNDACISLGQAVVANFGVGDN
jgi:hydrogenase maturation protein HypF